MHSVDDSSALKEFLGKADIEQQWHLLITFTGYHESLANQVYARHVYLPKECAAKCDLCRHSYSDARWWSGY